MAVPNFAKVNELALYGWNDAQGKFYAVAVDALGNLTTGGSASGLSQPARVTLFDATANQAGSTQKAKLFPTTIAITGGALPTLNAGTAAMPTLTNGGNVVGAVFSPGTTWLNVLLDFAGVGNAAGNTLTVEIGRLDAAGGVPDVLASIVLTSSADTLGATTVNPFSGTAGGAHASVTWRFFDATAITAYDGLGGVIQSVSGVNGNGLSQIKLNVQKGQYYYVQVTALHANFTEVLCGLTPVVG